MIANLILRKLQNAGYALSPLRSELISILAIKSRAFGIEEIRVLLFRKGFHLTRNSVVQELTLLKNHHIVNGPRLDSGQPRYICIFNKIAQSYCLTCQKANDGSMTGFTSPYGTRCQSCGRT
ncbi:MAG: hypothetical protein WCJ29_01505 [bacterium]